MILRSKTQNWEGKSVFNWKSIKLKRNVLCFRQSQLYVLHVCKRIFKFELQLSSYWQNIKFSLYCPKFHIFTKIVIFQVFLQLFRPTASFLKKLWQGHVRNTLFHFCQLWAVKFRNLKFCIRSKKDVSGQKRPVSNLLKLILLDIKLLGKVYSDTTLVSGCCFL